MRPGTALIIETCTDTGCGECFGDWWTGDLDVGVHVVPVNDTAPHHTTGCPCAPVSEMQVHDCGGVGHVRFSVIHNSFDGREDNDDR